MAVDLKRVGGQTGDVYMANSQARPKQDWFLYQFPLVSFGAAAATLRTTLTIDSDADFICVKVTCTVKQSAVIVQDWGGTMFIQDTTAGRYLSNQPFPVDAINGSGQHPYYMDPNRRFAANSTVVVDIQQFVAVATDVFLTLHGWKEYH